MLFSKQSLQSGALVPMVALVSNPESSANLEHMDRVRALVRKSANLVHFELKSITDIEDALGLFARATPTLLVINGGDGTIGAVLSALIRNNPFKVIPPIAILPGGKTNMTAADLGFKGSPEAVLKTLLKLVRTGRVSDHLSSRSLIELDLGDGSATRVGTFVGGAGIVPAIHWCREKAYASGYPNVVSHALAFFKLVRMVFAVGKNFERGGVVSDMTLKVRGTARWDGRYCIFVASTLDSVMMGIRPFGTVGAGRLQYSLIDADRRSLLRAIRGLITGTYGKGNVKGVTAGRGNTLELKTDAALTLDGEILTPVAGKPVILRSGKSLTFVRL